MRCVSVTLEALQPPVPEVPQHTAEGDGGLVTEPRGLAGGDGVEAGAEVGAGLRDHPLEQSLGARRHQVVQRAAAARALARQRHLAQSEVSTVVT